MSDRPKRTGSEQDYRELAGMSKPAGRGRARSVKSARTDKSKKTMGEELIDELGSRDEELGLGETVLDDPVPDNVEQEEVYDKIMAEYDEEERKLSELEVRVQCRQKVVEKRKLLQERRREVEAKAWQQKLELRERQLRDQEEFVRLKEKEDELKERQQHMEKKAAEFRARELEEKLPETVDYTDTHTRVAGAEWTTRK